MMQELFDRVPGDAGYSNDYGLKRCTRRLVAEDAYAAHLEGMSVEEIAEAASCTVPAVVSVLKREYGVSVETPEDRFRKGLFGPVFDATIEQAAEICGVNYPAMHAWCRKHGVQPRSGRAS